MHKQFIKLPKIFRTFKKKSKINRNIVPNLKHFRPNFVGQREHESKAFTNVKLFTGMSVGQWLCKGDCPFISRHRVYCHRLSFGGGVTSCGDNYFIPPSPVNRRRKDETCGAPSGGLV